MGNGKKPEKNSEMLLQEILKYEKSVFWRAVVEAEFCTSLQE